MSDFCSQCSPFPESDIDLFKIALHLNNGRSWSFICEGCNNRAIYKDDKGLLYLAKQEGNELKMHPVRLEELIVNH